MQKDAGIIYNCVRLRRYHHLDIVFWPIIWSSSKIWNNACPNREYSRPTSACLLACGNNVLLQAVPYISSNHSPGGGLLPPRRAAKVRHGHDRQYIHSWLVNPTLIITVQPGDLKPSGTAVAIDAKLQHSSSLAFAKKKKKKKKKRFTQNI